MEATSHYAWHLHLYLASSSELLPYKPTFYVLNPSIVKGFKKIYTFLPKTDSIDAIIIASIVSGSANSTQHLCLILNMLRYNALPECAIILFTI
ncbi:transposase [Caldicellulosiruptor bescii]|uniref:transposase n=1 Tax=Caldicellulosiruptor bescii TaxID=31899 RepID=UPI0002FDDD79|nr:transposase [Caldicellulosiruptor bescii]